MKTNIVQLHNITPEEFKNELLEGFESKLKEFQKRTHSKANTEYLTRKEVGAFLKITMPTLLDWSNKNILKAYRIGNRVLFKKEEIENVLKNSRK